MTSLSSLKLFITHAHPCSYLPKAQAATLFVDPAAHITADIYSQLSDLGFRRSGEHLYRPQCESCNACIPVRIPVAHFTPSRAQKRCLQRNQDLTLRVVSTINSPVHYALYQDYITHRHGEGDMYPPSLAQYTQFLGRTWAATDYLEFWLASELIAVAVSDRLQQGVSAIYTFYSPQAQHQARSLGVLAVLAQIQRAQQLGLPYVYLGYWIQNCRNMAYKTQYQPLEYGYDRTWTKQPPVAIMA